VFETNERKGNTIAIKLKRLKSTLLTVKCGCGFIHMHIYMYERKHRNNAKRLSYRQMRLWLGPWQLADGIRPDAVLAVLRVACGFGLLG
jgi:hypothetical protein